MKCGGADDGVLCIVKEKEHDFPPTPADENNRNKQDFIRLKPSESE